MNDCNELTFLKEHECYFELFLIQLHDLIISQFFLHPEKQKPVRKIDQWKDTFRTFLTKLLINALACSRSSGFRLFNNRWRVLKKTNPKRIKINSMKFRYFAFFFISIEDRFRSWLYWCCCRLFNISWIIENNRLSF